MKKIKINFQNNISDVFIVKKIPKGYLVTAVPFKKGEEPKEIFHIEDSQLYSNK